MAKKESISKMKQGANPDLIVRLYIESVLETGERPASVYKFCKEADLVEDEFYAHYGSFDALETAIWRDIILGTIESLRADAAYASFTTREKVLSFYYTLIELMKRQRSFILFQLDDWDNATRPPRYLSRVRKDFDEWVTQVLEEGKATGEIAKRPYADRQYPNVLWLHFLFIVNFWLRDMSPGMEQTDAAVEKSVNLAFEVIGKGVIEQTLDFGKFLYQQYRY